MIELDKKYCTALNSWLEHSDQRAAEILFAKRHDIPQMFRTYTKTLYRGMVVDQQFLDKLNKKPQTAPFYTSWSKDKKVSLGFLKDPAFKISTKSNIDTLLEKTFTTSDIVVDIHSLSLFLGMGPMADLGIDELAIDSSLKELEILIRKGITITKKDITIL